MPDFSQRSQQPELMDGGGISFAEFHDCLQTLARINTLTLAYRPTLDWLGKFSGEKLRLLDAGSGGGDMLRHIRRKFADFKLTGVDLNPWSKKSAELSAATGIDYQTANIFDVAPGEVDIIISSLFAHHLTDAQLIDFLRWMEKTANRGWLINDLHRHWLPYWFIKYAVLLSRNRLIRHDAPVSVARAFTAADWHEKLRQAGITGAKVSWFFPFRLCVSKVRP